jgi:NAD(P)-dependent dehydrogenase (short-subunit alcohol dehydrogenase family)
VPVDVSQARDVEAVVRKMGEVYGRLDGALNNAGIQREMRQSAECSEENWNRLIAINLTEVWLCMKHELAYMLPQRSSTIVNTTSNFGLVGSQGMPAYSASKRGVLGLTKTTALEYAKVGIWVNAVCPGPTQTLGVDRILSQQPQLATQTVKAIKARAPVGRMGQPKEIAEAVVWLCSEAPSFVTDIALAMNGGFVAQ